MVQKIRIEDKEYDVDTLSTSGQQNLAAFQTLTSKIQESQNMLAILNKARTAYMNDLKQEMISSKAGFSFEND